MKGLKMPKPTLVQDLPSSEEEELNPHLVSFAHGLLEEHLAELPVEVAETISGEEVLEWARMVVTATEDGVTVILENVIGILEVDYLPSDDGDASDDDDVEEDEDVRD